MYKVKYKVSTMASEEPGRLNESLEVHPTLKEKAMPRFLPKGHC